MGRDSDDDERDDEEQDGDGEDSDDDQRDDEEQDGDGGDGRQHRPWAWAAGSSLVILVGLVMLASYPSESREARRYHQAEPCAADAAPRTCVEVVDAVVEGTRKVGFKRPDYYVRLRVGEGARFPPHRQPASVEVEDTGEVYDSLRPGDRVQLGYWGRNIVRITKPGIGTVETTASPKFSAGVALGLGAVLPIVGGLSFRFAIRLRRRTGSWTTKGAVLRGRTSPPRALGVGALVGAVVGSLIIGDSNTYEIGEAVGIWTVTAIAGALVAVFFLAVARLVRRARG